MGFLFLLYPAASNSAIQHPCRKDRHAHQTFTISGDKRNLCFKLLILGLFLAAGLPFSPTSAHAALNCNVQPSCQELGYSQTISPSCPSDKIIRCPFDKSYKMCIVSDCQSFGFTQTNKNTWCGQIVQCPADSSYTLCAQAYENPCPAGYDTRLLSVADCGSQGSNGWTFDKQLIPSTDGTTLTCGRCVQKTCTGFDVRYQSKADCGSASVTDKSGWKFTTCYYGDELRGKCTAYSSCTDAGYQTSSAVDDGLNLCKPVTVRLGDGTTSCQDCVRCNNATTWPSWVSKIDIGPQGAASYCSNHSNYTGAFGTTWATGTWKDAYGRTATKCKVMTTHQSGQLGVSCGGCCKNGGYDGTSNCYRGWSNKICSTL